MSTSAETGRTPQRAQQRPAAPSSEDAVEARKEEIGGHLDNHGHSKPAWTGVTLVMLGALVASIAILIPLVWLVITGLAIMAAGGPVGWLMARAADRRDPAQGEKHAVK